MTSLVMLSGGLDSTVTATIAKDDLGKGEDLYAISFSYGQRHARKELEQASLVSETLGIKEHHFVRIPFSENFFKGNTSLVVGDKGQYDVPSPTRIETKSGIPNTWVPQRNMLFLTYAFGFADTIEADKVYTGFNAVDYSGYPDCRPEFVKAANQALNLARKRFVEEDHIIDIITPIIHMSKADIIRMGNDVKAPLHLTYSCYYGEDLPCRECDSCRIRETAFGEVGIKDPASII
jgi:7-cyano-7-deazaguanine synthase